MLPNKEQDYIQWVVGLKKEIQLTQLRITTTANTQLIEFYWKLGKDIVEMERTTQWGNKLIDMLSIDLRNEFPNLKGFSRRNLYAIRQWYLFFSAEFEFVPQAVAQLPWGHQRLIISKIKEGKTAIGKFFPT